MPGLSALRRRVRTRLTGERGATAVIVALLLVPLLGFAAIAVDVGALYAERARLQTAADAAALAVARDCALGDCGDMQATADELVEANLGAAVAEPPLLGSNTVTVTGNTPTEHWFAPVIGHDSTQVSAVASVAWGAPGGGTASLPLIFSWCEWNAQTAGGMPSGAEQTILLPKKSDTGCTGSNGMFVPGGFGWLVPDEGGNCERTSTIGTQVSSEPGNNPSKGCTAAHLDALLHEVVLLPIFKESGGTGSGAWYRVHAYAAFELTDYYFAGKFKGSGKACGGSERCIKGRFLRWVYPADDFTYDPTAPAMGAWILRLVR
jgi:hypothetical protein